LIYRHIPVVDYFCVTTSNMCSVCCWATWHLYRGLGIQIPLLGSRIRPPGPSWAIRGAYWM